MTDHSIQNLVETRKRIITQVNQGLVAAGTAASILGMTRQGLWKLRKKVSLYGIDSIIGLKRGPKSYYRAWNRKPEWVEEKVSNLFSQTGGVGADRLLWFLDDGEIEISRATIYRILVRKRLLVPKQKGKREKPHHYTVPQKLDHLLR